MQTNISFCEKPSLARFFSTEWPNKFLVLYSIFMLSLIKNWILKNCQIKFCIHKANEALAQQSCNTNSCNEAAKWLLLLLPDHPVSATPLEIVNTWISTGCPLTTSCHFTHYPSYHLRLLYACKADWIFCPGTVILTSYEHYFASYFHCILLYGCDCMHNFVILLFGLLR